MKRRDPRTGRRTKQDTPPGPPEECNCPCHRAPLAVRHPVPCCERCPLCGRRIASAYLAQHLARHGRPGGL